MPSKADELIAELLALALEQFERGRKSQLPEERDCCYANAANYAKEAAAALIQSRQSVLSEE